MSIGCDSSGLFGKITYQSRLNCRDRQQSTENRSKALKLHSFGDASKSCVAAYVYAVVEQASGTNQGLVTARAWSPKQGLTILRMELVATHMVANLVVNVRKVLTGFPVESNHCWTDSSVVLHWLKGNGDYKQFVTNRVKKINAHQDLIW